MVVKKVARKAKNVTKAQTLRLINSNKYFITGFYKTINLTENTFNISLIPATNNYKKWLKNNIPSTKELKLQKDTKFTYTPKISIVVPVYKTPLNLLKECINSVLSQTYGNWQLVLVDDASKDQTLTDVIEGYINQDKRIQFITNTLNMHISATTNIGIDNSSGEYVGFLDHDDILYSNALFEVVRSLQKTKHDFIYTDEDKLSANGKIRSNPFFKPDWSPDFLRSINYITHFSVIKKSLINKVGGLRSKYDGAQDWDLFLRTTRIAKSIHHIPKVLYGWRMIQGSTAQATSAKPYVVNAQKQALVDDVCVRGYDANVKVNKYNKDYWDVEYKIKESPLVSVVIPTKNQYKIVKRCVESIIQTTTYKNYEIVLVDTGSDDKNVLNWYKTHNNNKKIKIYSWPEQPFSYARACNYGAKNANGKYLIMLNNDTAVITPNWIQIMLGDAQRPEVGTVGVRLYYPGNKLIQHAGIGIGLGGYAANIMSGQEANNLSILQNLYGNNKRNVACSTAACLMISKDLFIKYKGFDEAFSVTYNDVDLGLRLHSNGYLNVYNPVIELTHYESISLGVPGQEKRDNAEFKKAQALLYSRWGQYIEHDPYYNKNFTKLRADFSY